MEQRNVLLAFVLSMLILLGWGFLFPPQETATPVEEASVSSSESLPATEQSTPELRPDQGQVASASAGVEVQPTQADSSTLDDKTSFVVSNDLITLSLNDRGWLIGAKLLKYTESIEPGAAQVNVLSIGDKHAMYINSGVMGAQQSSAFKQVSKGLQNGVSTLVLESVLADGRLWQRTLHLTPGSYVVQMEDRIQNGAGLKMFKQVVERYPDTKLNTFYEHVGPIGLINGKLQEVDYEDLDSGEAVRMASIGGWSGMMNRYFIAALYGDQAHDYRYYYKGDGRSYQSGLLDDGAVVDGVAKFSSDIYLGPKSIPVMETVGIGLQRSVDFGWFAFIAKPLHEFMLWLYDYVPNFGWNIIILVLMIKILFYWPTQKSYQSMAAMRKIQPEMKRLQELYGSDRQKLGQEMMDLYRKNKVNPMGGCLPIIIQIPVFFALYKVLLMSIEMRQAPFIGWLQDLSVQDPYYILPVLMGISMFVQFKLNPQQTDPMMQKVMQIMPAIFTVMFLFFPAGLVLYWLVNNILSIAQQRFVMHRMGVK